MICCRCSRSAVGRALDGLPYCEQPACKDWKLERQAAQRERDQRYAEILRAYFERFGRTACLISPPSNCALPLELMVTDEMLGEAAL